ncbi:MAG: ferritin-like domain-containing protein, partial [Gammaproteobacteria bacterium]
HFSLLNQRLQEMGYAYGDFDAHDGLWEMACKTDHDVLVRMALVPRVLEARGLDVTPGMIQRLIKVGDLQSVEILQVIFRDEIGHVEIGSHWYNFLCDARGLESAVTFKQLLEEYMKGQIRGPFEHAARMKAGFSEIELSTLENMSGENQFDR